MNDLDEYDKQKGGGTPNLFTVSQMPFFRRPHLKSLTK